jgi:ADP-ribose pyrophosphatase YjhB (NUDIX family)
VSLLDLWRWCPRCREELDVAKRRASCPWCGFVAYANSAPTANALVVDAEGRVMLARRAIDPYRGFWDIPGGFLEEGEHPLEGVRRELREEAGLEVEPAEFLCATVDRYGDGPSSVWTLNLVWTARLVAGEPAANDDVAELGWFAADELPAEDELAFSSVKDVLRAWVRTRSARAVDPDGARA